MVWLDDTGWRVGARPQNLRVLLSEQVTVYVIEPHRGYAEAAAILGADYAGFLVHDGARCFYGFAQAHQSCLEHLIRRCREMIQVASPAAAQFPLAVKTLLQQSLRLRDRYQQGEVSPHGLAVALGAWKSNWTACWIDTFAARTTNDWPNTCAMSNPICSRFCAVLACMPPITSPSGPSG